jgi:SAM-dependent methyltransferase
MLRKFITNLLGGSRLHPTMFDTCWYVYSAIRIFLEDSVATFRENSKNKKLDVLDFGCGNQPYRYLFQSDNYTWCDIGDSPEYNDKISTILEWEKLPYPDTTFDLILCTEVMEHIKFPELYASEFARVLKKWWLLLITVPQIWNYHPYPQHFFNYTPDWLDLFLSEYFPKKEIFSDTSPFQSGMMIAMMYTDCKTPFLKAPYIFLTNSLFLVFPKYRTYNHASSHIFVRYFKK